MNQYLIIISNDQLVLCVQVLNQCVNSQGDSRNEFREKRDEDTELSHKKRRLLLFDISSYMRFVKSPGSNGLNLDKGYNLWELCVS